MIVRENPDELTLRAEEVGTSKALMNVGHIEPERWGLLLGVVQRHRRRRLGRHV